MSEQGSDGGLATRKAAAKVDTRGHAWIFMPNYLQLFHRIRLCNPSVGSGSVLSKQGPTGERE